jgi:hypothetical protein
VQPSETYLRRVLDGSRSVTVVVDLGGIVRYVSGGIGQVVGGAGGAAGRRVGLRLAPP